MIFKLKRLSHLALILAILLGFLSVLTVAQAQNNGPIITAVSPPFGWADEDVYLYIEGYGFEEPLTVTLNYTELNVTSVQDELIIAQVPQGMDPGFYSVNVETANGSDSEYDAYKVLLLSNKEDLTSSSDWIWTEPRTLYVNGPVNSGVGLNLQRLGGFKENGVLKSVTVGLIQRHATGDEELGQAEVRFIAPEETVSTPKVIWEPETAGEHTICAIIDPDNEIEEINPEEPGGGEGNNEICRTITVLPEAIDMTPPIVLQNPFQINNGEPNTTNPTVSLDVKAEDSLPNPRSGVDALDFIEYDYGSNGWYPVKKSGWVPYSEAHENYLYSLQETFGSRYLRVWAVDKAGNISRASAIEDINLLTPPKKVGFLEDGEVDFYRIFVQAGQTLSVTLTPESGDPDLYIWTPSGDLWYDGDLSATEDVSFEALELGTYQIEVHGYTAAEYRLSFEVTDDDEPQGLRAPQGESDKELPTAPWVAISDLPLEVYVDPPTLPVSNNIYLPMMSR